MDTDSGAAAETSATDAGQEAAQAVPPSPETPSQGVPSGHRMVSDADYERFIRNEERVKGVQQTYGKIKEAGFDSVDDLLSVLPDVQKFRQSNVDVGGLAAALGIGQQEAQEPNIEDQVRDLVSGMLGEHKAEQASASHERALQAELKKIESVVEELAGEGASKSRKAMLTGYLTNEVWGGVLAQDYPQGHALHGKGLGNPEGVADRVVGAYRDMLKAEEGQSAADVADAAMQKPKPASTSGAGGAQGKPESRSKNTPADLRAQAEKLLAANKAKRTGQPVSQG